MDIDTYLANLAPDQMTEYQRIHSIVTGLVPEGEVLISYGIPTWKLKGKYLLYFAAYKTHMSIHPASNELLEELQGQLGSFKITDATKKSSGTIQFTKDNLVPQIVIEQIVLRRIKKIEGK